ncbi:hypothetical protein CDAR_381641 [Caerostris darwini]|uniref:Uncharacterized protein n=1 Tax=Caerostris darwini TaxID=1538125 RepID=A0AAV4V4Q3_9ARAC|nr:hypothetical protein CDAR_381641 [Caerostris darwini]
MLWEVISNLTLVHAINIRRSVISHLWKRCHCERAVSRQAMVSHISCLKLDPTTMRPSKKFLMITDLEDLWNWYEISNIRELHTYRSCGLMVLTKIVIGGLSHPPSCVQQASA